MKNPSSRAAGNGASPSKVSRRAVLKGAAMVGVAAAVNLPLSRPAYAAKSLKVSTFGGYFEEAFKKFIYSVR